MKKLLICFVTIICCAHAIEYSHRIKALGTDFAYLIPDYETDLYRNPQILGQKSVGIFYDPNSQIPIKLMFLSKGFGIYSKYWPNYYYAQWQASGGWQSSEMYSFHFEDLWMLKIKDDVWNIYNDGYFEISESYDEYGVNALTKTFEYFFKSQSSYNIGRFFNFDIKIGMGFFNKLDQIMDGANLDQLAGIPSGRIGFFYRNAPLPNKFTSWFIEFGGPLSTDEIDALPYSIYLNLYEYDRRKIWFANTFVSKFAWAKGLAIDDKSFVTIGLCEDFLYQRTKQVDTSKVLRAINNTLSFPLALEYVVNRFTLRFGTKFYYNIISRKESSNSTIIEKDVTHNINYGYSFGLGWQPTERFIIDLYNNNYALDRISSWAIYLKYLF